MADRTLSKEVLNIPVSVFAHGEGLPLPIRQTPGSAGMDLHAALLTGEEIKLPPGGFLAVPCGFAMALPEGYEAQVRPRSGLAFKHGVTVLNAPGTIDADYRGEVKVILINHGALPFCIARGDRIAQMVIAEVTAAALTVTAKLDDTSRGGGGFGSTGTGS